jgi:MFS transporter, OPA family, sugar phosphate sensor protein UhpC
MFIRAFALTWIAYFGLYLCRKNFSVIMPFLKSEEGFSSPQLATVLFCYSLAYALGQIAIGPVADRWGARKVVSLGALISAGCSAITSTATGLVWVQGLNGAAQASGWPGILRMAREWFPETKRSVILAWWGTHMVLGGLAGSAFAAFCAQFGWRYAAIVPAAVLVFIAIAFAAFSRDKSSTGPTQICWPGFDRELWSNRRLRSIAAMYFQVKLLRYAFLFWLPLYMTEELGYGAIDAGYTSAIFELVGFGGVLVAGYASQNGGAGKRYAVAASMMFVLAGLCVFYPYFSRLGPAANLAGIALLGAFTFGPDTLMAGAGVQDAVRAEKTATAGGLVNGLGSMGQIVSPLLVSLLSVKYGWPVLFAALSLAALAGGLILALEVRHSYRFPVEET